MLQVVIFGDRARGDSSSLFFQDLNELAWVTFNIKTKIYKKAVRYSLFIELDF